MSNSGLLAMNGIYYEYDVKNFLIKKLKIKYREIKGGQLLSIHKKQKKQKPTEIQ